jgi:hypothetical protein
MTQGSETSTASEAGSGIEGMRADSAFARVVAERLTEPFKLVDVGAAGGVAPGWRVFGDRLAAAAYEADQAEAARLNAAERNPAVRYFGGYVELPAEHPLRQRLGVRLHQQGAIGGRLGFERLRVIRADRAAGRTPMSMEVHFREWVAGIPCDRPRDGYDLDYASAYDVPAGSLPAVSASADGRPSFFLPEHLSQEGFLDADFLKIDVDGPDFELLRGSSELLARPSLLGAALEVTFVGSHDANDNTFHNTDRLMREKGFSLFGLSVRRYSSAALPSLFMDHHPAASLSGRPLQGDAIYLRDLASPFWREDATASSDDKLLKLAALFSLFELPDQAAELLVVHRQRFAAHLDVDAALELLTEQAQESSPEGINHGRWIEMFEAEDPFFFDVYGKQARWLAGLQQAKLAAPQLAAEAEARVAQAQAQAEKARAAQVEAEAALAALQATSKHLVDSEIALRAIRASTVWRASAPLRAAIDGLNRLRGR